MTDLEKILTGLTPLSQRACDLPEYAPQLSQLDRQPF